MSSDIEEKIRAYFVCYEQSNRDGLAELFHEGFVFTSPYDDGINKDAYFEKCWPYNELTHRMKIEKLFDRGDEAFVQYEVEMTDGTRMRNTEFIKAKDGRISDITVYFGALPTSPPETAQ